MSSLNLNHINNRGIELTRKHDLPQRIKPYTGEEITRAIMDIKG